LRLRSVVVAVCLGLGLLAWTSWVRADPQERYELARSRYKSGRYEEAVEILRKLIAKPIGAASPRAAETRRIYRQARPILAAALVGLGRVDEADEVILAELMDDPFYELPVGQFPDAVGDRFIAVRAAHRAELDRRKQEVLAARRKKSIDQSELQALQRARIAKLEKMAAEKVVVTEHSRLLAAVPFGVGQFHNDEAALGVFFLATELGGLAASVVTATVHQSSEDVFRTSCFGDRLPDPDTGQPVDCPGLADRLDTLRIANWITLGGTAALLIAGVIEAEAAFVPTTVRKRKRKLPPPVTVEPAAAVGEHGVLVGLRARF